MRSCSRLHSKVYLTNEAVIVGSSNASANGLAYEGGELDGWHEANVLTDSPEFLADISIWFNRLWNDPGTITIDVGSDLFKAAEAAWNDRRSRIPWQREPTSLFDACRLNPEKFFNVFLAIHDEPLDKEAETRRKKVSKGTKNIRDLPLALGNSLWAYQDWHEIPSGAWLIDIDNKPTRKRPFFGGYAKVHDPAVTDKFRKDSILTYAIRQSRNRKGVMVGQTNRPLILSEGDMALISRHINVLFPKEKDETIGGKLIKLPDAVRYIDEAEAKRKIR